MSRFKLVFFVPRDKTRAVLDLLFQKYPNHVGHIGNYQHCAAVSPMRGQFRPVEGANPTVGQVGDLEYVDEDRVEVLVQDEPGNAIIKGTIEELKKAHPYEEVAYDVYRLEDF